MLFVTGDVIESRYRVEDYIGKGGMSEVYLGFDTKTRRKVALKVLTKMKDANPVSFKRFNLEIEVMSMVSHPNIVEIIDYFLTPPYIIVLEYVKGISLKQIIKRRAPLSLKEIIMIVKQLLAAMIEIENNNIIHRDLKPQNIIITSSGLIKILDFGIAMIGNTIDRIKDKNIVGSVQYMSPETVRNSNITIRSDIYSMGIVIYEMITGTVPFHGNDNIKVAIMHVKNKVPSIKESSDSFHDDLDYIIKKATEKDPDKRYQTFKEFSDDFDAFVNLINKYDMNMEKAHKKSALNYHFEKNKIKRLLSFFTRGWNR